MVILFSLYILHNEIDRIDHATIIPQSWDAGEVIVHVEYVFFVGVVKNVLNSEPTCQNEIIQMQAVPNNFVFSQYKYKF